MKNFFALALAVVLFVSPIAMAGELNSADSDFLFGTEQVASTTVSAEEMTATAGQGINVNTSVNASGNVTVVAPFVSGSVQVDVHMSMSVSVN